MTADTQAVVDSDATRWSLPLKGDSPSNPPADQIRKLILQGGIPLQDAPSASVRGSLSSWRSLAWKLLLGVDSLPAQEYLDLVSKGESVAHEKIRNDTFRTLTTDTGFRERVHEEKLIRVLNAFVWSHADEETISADLMSGYEFTYVQGMNVLAAPFLYTMPTELEAYHCFKRFIEFCCPLYVQPTLAGVHRGLQLLDQCFEHADPELFGFLRSKNLSAEIYAFPSVLTLCACTPPLEQVLELWDFFLAFGVHMNVMCVIAQLELMRDDLLALASNSEFASGAEGKANPYTLLRVLPPLQARLVIKEAVKIAKGLPKELYDQLVCHTYQVDS